MEKNHYFCELMVKCLLELFIHFPFSTIPVNAQCPMGKLCEGCDVVPGKIFEMECSLAERPINQRFIIRLKPQAWLSIICDTNANWDYFYLGQEQQLDFTESIFIKLCQLPRNGSLGSIVRQIVKADIRDLDYQSYKNLTTNFNKNTFNDLESLQKLVLSHNNLVNVAVDLFSNVIALKHLDMSQNRLEDLPVGLFDLPHLVYLDLSYNKLRIIKSGLFRTLIHLTTLRLASNNLKELGSTVFKVLKSLKTLDLIDNDLRVLTKDVFGGLIGLNAVDLSKNQFSTEGISPHLFSNNEVLEKVILTHNKRHLYSLPHGILAGLQYLVAVNFSGNGLVIVSEDLFADSINLQNISLAKNKLSRIPHKLLYNLEAARIIELSDNEISDMSVKTFHLLSKVEILDLSQNRLQEFNNIILDYLTSLKVLDLAHNWIDAIRHEGICPFFYTISGNGNARKNSLRSTRKSVYYARNEAHRAFLSCAVNIERVFLHGNRLQDSNMTWLISEKLELVTLNDNRITNISINDIQFYSGNVSVTYDGNQIKNILFDNNNNFPIRAESLRLHMGNNPIYCDCRLYDLLKFRDGEMSYHFHSKLTIDMRQLKCAQPKELQHQRIEELERIALKCLVENATSRDLTCPMKCKCWQRPQDHGYLVDCSYMNFTKAPESLESPTGYHIELNLTGNLIRQMPSMDQAGYRNVTKLILSKNNISFVNQQSLSETLEVLLLDFNNITELNSDVLYFLSNLKTLTHLELHHNPFICNCNTVDFLKFIQAHIPKLPQLRNVICESSSYPIYQTTPEEICPRFVGPLIIIGTTVALMGIIIGFLASIYYRYQQEIKVWLYAKNWCLWFVSEDQLDKDRMYDAFVSFCQLDAPFVNEILVPTLEEEPHHFHLCIHNRDWIPGESIPDQIIKSVNDSKRTIIVLSSDYLRSIWAKTEFRTAHKQALREGRARVIIILLEKIESIGDLDSELMAYLSINTYLRWGDPWFWMKLAYALPHSENQLRRSRKYQGAESINHRMEFLSSKSTINNDPNVEIPTL